MKQHRHYGQYINKSIIALKKKHSDYKYQTWIWDKLDPEYEIHVQVTLKKKQIKK